MQKYLVRGMLVVTLFIILGTAACLYPAWHTERLLGQLQDPSPFVSDHAGRSLLRDRWIDGRTLTRHLGDPVVGDWCLAVLNRRWNLDLKSYGDKPDPPRLVSILWMMLEVPNELPRDSEALRARCEDAVRRDRFGSRLDLR